MVGALSRALAEGRLARALLFHGPAGVGKLTTALALCRGLLCSRTAPSACGSCEGCRRTAGSSLRHPDVGLLWPQPRSEAAEGSETGDALSPPDLHGLQDEVRRNPAWRILVDRARSRLASLAISPSLGPRRVLLILSSERLGDEAGNALLKMLEEPPGNALIVILCESLPALLPTIRSRCQAYHFSPLRRQLVEDYLKERTGVGPETARLLAALSGGRIGHALSLTRDAESYRARRAMLARVLSEVRRERTVAASLAAAGELRSGEAEDLSILMDILRDEMVRGCGCHPSLLTDSALPEVTPDLALVPAEAASLLPRVERTRQDLRRYVNPQLALEALFVDLGLPPASGERDE